MKMPVRVRLRGSMESLLGSLFKLRTYRPSADNWFSTHPRGTGDLLHRGRSLTSAGDSSALATPRRKSFRNATRARSALRARGRTNPKCMKGKLDAIAQVQFLKDVVQVRFDRALADRKALRDFRVA